MQSPVIFYHGNCFDGHTAAWAARKHFLEHGVEPEFYPLMYGPNSVALGMPDLEVLEDRHVFMVDFCVDRATLLEINDLAAEFVVLDHHKTAEADCQGLEFCVFDMERSGAGITWDYFFGHEPRPWVVDYVEDRDLWKFKLPNSKTVHAHISCHDLTWENWDAMAAQPLENAFILGKGAQAQLSACVRDTARYARRARFPSAPGAINDGFFEIPVVNVNRALGPDLIKKLSEGELFAAGWSEMAEGTFQYSLRTSDPMVDVSEIAKRFGGGGHRAAAGFTVARLVHV